MAASEIRAKYANAAPFTISLKGIANLAARSSAELTNTDKAPRAKIHARVYVGTDPTAGTTIDFYLLRSNNGSGTASPALRTDEATDADATMSGGIINAQPIGSLVLSVATSDKIYVGDFMVEDLGPKWGIAVVNRTNKALRDHTDNNNSITYEYMVPEAQ